MKITSSLGDRYCASFGISVSEHSSDEWDAQRDEKLLKKLRTFVIENISTGNCYNQSKETLLYSKATELTVNGEIIKMIIENNFHLRKTFRLNENTGMPQQFGDHFVCNP